MKNKLLPCLIYLLTVYLQGHEPCLLQAIALVESGNNSAAVGKAGETGKYQLTPRTRAWAKGNTDKEKVLWLREWHRKCYIRNFHRDPSVKEFYVWYNSGRYKTKNKTILERAQRVQNLYDSIHSRSRQANSGSK